MSPFVHQSGLLSTLLFTAVACSTDAADNEGADDTSTQDSSEETTSDSSIDTEESDSGSTSTIFMRQADCTLPPPPIGEIVTHTWNGPHEDFTFSTEGKIVGANGQAFLTYTPFGGPAEVIRPLPDGGLNVKGTRYLPDGSLLIATPNLGALTRIFPDGTEEIVGSGMPVPNGIAIHPSGRAYVAAGNGIWRFDSHTGETDRLIETTQTLDGISFSPDYTQLFFNTEFRKVWVAPVIDDAGNLGEKFLGPNLDLPAFDILDGMASDACGNLYVLAMSGTIFRISTDQSVEEIELPNTIPIGTPALNFGTGVGGFEKDHLYVMDFRGQLHDVDVGIVGKWEPHLPKD